MRSSLKKGQVPIEGLPFFPMKLLRLQHKTLRLCWRDALRDGVLEGTFPNLAFGGASTKLDQSMCLWIPKTFTAAHERCALHVRALPCRIRVYNSYPCGQIQLIDLARF